jgi:protein ImuB
LYAAVWQPPQEHAAAVRGVADAFSPRYEMHGDDLVVIDVAGLTRLLGPAATIADELRREASERGMRVQVAVAGTQTAAIVLALARPGVTIVARGDDAAALAAVPIDIVVPASIVAPSADRAALDPASAVAAFTRWGLKTLGELAALPDADLVSRMGARARVWQALARGEDRRPLVPTAAEERFESSLDLEWPIEGLEPLSFVLTRLLEPLSTRLERRDRGAAVLHVVLGLVSKDTFARRLELPSPMREVRTLRTLALLDLEAHPPPAAIDRVVVIIDPTPGRVLQHTLFTRAQPTPEQLSTLVARLGALMGQDRFGAPAVVDTYRPGAFEMQAFGTDHEGAGKAGGAGGAGGEKPSGQFSDQPYPPGVVSALRRCRHPVPARVALVDERPVRVTTDRRGFAGGSVVQAAGPWRSSGDWWAGDAGRAGGAGTPGRAGGEEPSVKSTHPPHPPHLPWDHDEWDVSLTDGAVYRIVRDRHTDAWFIEGIFD